MNSKFLTILTLIIAIVALVVSIAALNKAGGRPDVQRSIESFKSEIEPTITELKEIGDKIATTGTKGTAQMKTRLELAEAKVHLAIAKMNIALENNYNKAGEELKKAAANFKKARSEASKEIKGKITKLETKLVKVQQDVKNKSSQAADKLTDLIKGTEETDKSAKENP